MILIVLSPLLLFGVYVVGVLIYGTINDWKPDEIISITPGNMSANQSAIQPGDSTFRAIIWNIGYSGLGADADFFYDGGHMVRSPKNKVENYFKGIKEIISQYNKYDFIALQEVDRHSKRSYYLNEYESIATLLPEHNHALALNFNVPFVPVKYWDPIGHVESGVATYSKHTLIEAKRYQFPGSFSWPSRVFNLDRCFLVTRYTLPNQKQLLFINTHNSAYDNGDMKKQEMDYLKKFLLEEYMKGNAIVVGGDWNQCPPGFAWDSFAKKPETEYSQINVASDFLPAGWTWAYDASTATNRKLTTTYNASETFTTLIDFYLCSPNIEVLKVKGIETRFAYSDHQPVSIEFRVK